MEEIFSALFKFKLKKRCLSINFSLERENKILNFLSLREFLIFLILSHVLKKQSDLKLNGVIQNPK